MIASEDDDEVDPSFGEDVAGVVVEDDAAFRPDGFRVGVRRFVERGEERIEGV
jgi:hypothetical protein